MLAGLILAAALSQTDVRAAELAMVGQIKSLCHTEQGFTIGGITESDGRGLFAYVEAGSANGDLHTRAIFHQAGSEWRMVLALPCRTASASDRQIYANWLAAARQTVPEDLAAKMPATLDSDGGPSQDGTGPTNQAEVSSDTNAASTAASSEQVSQSASPAETVASPESATPAVQAVQQPPQAAPIEAARATADAIPVSRPALNFSDVNLKSMAMLAVPLGVIGIGAFLFFVVSFARYVRRAFGYAVLLNPINLLLIPAAVCLYMAVVNLGAETAWWLKPSLFVLATGCLAVMAAQNMRRTNALVGLTATVIQIVCGAVFLLLVLPRTRSMRRTMGLPVREHRRTHWLFPNS
jgi:hypothetical protein